MNLTITSSLTVAELALVRETDRNRLAGLDEDALVESARPDPSGAGT